MISKISSTTPVDAVPKPGRAIPDAGLEAGVNTCVSRGTRCPHRWILKPTEGPGRDTMGSMRSG
jgi:hypothetical protein